MSQINITFVFLFFLTMYILYINGKKIKALPENVKLKRYLKVSMPSIIIYTLNEGLRFGRGIDYNLYAKEYVYNTGSLYFENGDAGFRYVGIFLQNLGLPFQVFVLLMSFILIFSVIIFLKNVKGCAPVALPMFLLLFYTATENLMRWFLGFSFILIGFSFILNDSKNIRSYLFFTIFSIISFFFHFALIFVPFVYIILMQFKRPLLKPTISILLFILIGISFQSKIMISLKEYLDIFLLLSEKSTYYVDNAEQWLTSGASGLSLSSFPPLFRVALYIIEVILGYKLCKILNTKYIILYNIFLIGFIVLPIANQIELVLRYQYLIFIYQIVILGYIVDIYFISRKIKLNKILYTLSILSFLYFSQGQIRKWIFNEPDYKHLYIWDSKGKDFLDLEKTYYNDMEKE